MGQYYFLINALPPLSFRAVPEMSYEEVLSLLKENLSQADWELIQLLQWPVDLRNLRALWLEQPFDTHGNYSQEELEEALFLEEMPSFIQDFLDRYESTKDRLNYFAALLSALYQEAIAKTDGFLRSYYTFEREMRLILTALRAKRVGRNLAREFQFEDLTDPLVVFLLAQKEGDDLAVPQEYEDLKALFKENSSAPRELMLAIIHYQFKKIEEMETGDPFSLDRILAYLACLALIEMANRMDEDRGNPILEQLSS